MKHIFLAATIGAAAVVCAMPARAQTIDPPNAIVAGQPIADWTAGWWGRIMPFPVGATPLDDTTGALANVNNDGPVFYVAGTSGGTATRQFTVGAGTRLLIPMLNQVFIQYPVAIENQLVSDFYGGTLSLTATIDGVPVSNLTSYQETSPVVSFGSTGAGSFGEVFGPTAGFTGDPACPGFTPDELCPAISAGYWLMVKNLPPGEHVITVGGSEDYFQPNVPQLGLGGGRLRHHDHQHHRYCCSRACVGAFAVPGAVRDFALPQPNHSQAGSCRSNRARDLSGEGANRRSTGHNRGWKVDWRLGRGMVDLAVAVSRCRKSVGRYNRRDGD